MATSMLRIKQKEKVSNKMAARYQTGNQSAWKQFFTVSILSAEGCIRYGNHHVSLGTRGLTMGSKPHSVVLNGCPIFIRM